MPRSTACLAVVHAAEKDFSGSDCRNEKKGGFRMAATNPERCPASDPAGNPGRDRAQSESCHLGKPGADHSAKNPAQGRGENAVKTTEVT